MRREHGCFAAKGNRTVNGPNSSQIQPGAPSLLAVFANRAGMFRRRPVASKAVQGLIFKNVLPALLALTLSSCGYHTAGKGNILPDHVKTIAIPAFVNETQTYKLEQMLTGAVVREFTTRANYRIVPNADDDTDATLRGTVLSAATAPSTYDATTGRVASVLVTVNMKVALTGRDGKVLYENEQYQFPQGFASFFQEDTPALQRLSQDFAHTLVSNILEGF